MRLDDGTPPMGIVRRSMLYCPICLLLVNLLSMRLDWKKHRKKTCLVKGFAVGSCSEADGRSRGLGSFERWLSSRNLGSRQGEIRGHDGQAYYMLCKMTQ